MNKSKKKLNNVDSSSNELRVSDSIKKGINNSKGRKKKESLNKSRDVDESPHSNDEEDKRNSKMKKKSINSKEYSNKRK